MYEILPETTHDLLAIQVSGKLSKPDFDRLHPWLHQQLAEHPYPSILIVMEAFKGWDSIDALLEDAKVDAAHNDDVRRVAMVGGRVWQKWMTRMAEPFVKAEMKYFGLGELDAARAWALGGH